MQLQFIGCGDALGSGGRANTCFHVTGAGVNFLIDCGASSLPAMKRLEVERDGIDLILITHFHGDHFGGLPFFLLDAQFTRRTRPLVSAARGADLFIAEAYYYDRIVKNHLSLKTLEAHLPELNVRRLILTHMSDDMLAQLGQLAHTTASDGMVVEL
jgi:ribonuclease BN (tRNA processing enzyme)